MNSGISDENENNKLNAVLYKLMEEKVPYISIIRGGYIECHNIIMSNEPGFLIDHYPKACFGIFILF